MKHRLFIVTVALAGLTLASCIRKEEWEMLKHPVHVQGSVEPGLGAPIAYGQVTINDVLHMFNGDYTGLLDPEDNVLTINFNAQGSDSIVAKSLWDKKPGTKGTFFAKDTTIRYGVNITMFDNVTLQDIVNGNININHLWMDFQIDLRGDCPEAVRDFVRQNVHARFDSLVVNYIDYNGEFKTFPGVSMEPVPFDDVLTTKRLLFENVDLAEIVNSMPRRLEACFRFRFELDDTLFSMDLAEIYFNQVLDSVKMTKLYIDCKMQVAFPFEISIGSLPYSFDVDLGEGLSRIDIDGILDSIGEGVDVGFDSSYLILGFGNGIPLELDITGTMLDDHDLPLGAPLFNQRIKAAATEQSPDDPNVWVSTADSTTKVEVMMNRQRLNQLRNAKKIRFDMTMSTIGKHVAIRREDYLKIKVYLKLRPKATIDIPVTDHGYIH